MIKRKHGTLTLHSLGPFGSRQFCSQFVSVCLSENSSNATTMNTISAKSTPAGNNSLSAHHKAVAKTCSRMHREALRRAAAARCRTELR